MKTLTFIFLFLLGFINDGAAQKDTTITKKAYDSLRFELYQKKDAINSLRWANQLKMDDVKVDSIFVRSDSLIIRYRKGKKLICQKEILLTKVPLRKAPCIAFWIAKYHDSQERLIYTEYWEGICYDDTEEEALRGFEGKLAKKERIFYDNQHRLIRKYVFEDRFGRNIVQQTVYSYNGGRQSQVKKELDRNSFWD
jgi:hypothetical protein